MVQRKVPTMLPKTKTLFHLHHLKSNKGSDLRKRKMMKKSGSIKRPKTPGAMPNYMKPTTSSDARKEQSQSQSPVSRSILRRRSLDSLKIGVSSGKKATKTLLTRSLTKDRSFKPSRVSPRRRSTVVLCENLDAERPTCSSTLKDCKFPASLRLNQGGTESEGTSAIKVCSYTYCSLNGHHHAPLPPLKSFLSARRRAIKTQRSVKIGCLSPRRAKPVEKEDKDFFVEIYSKKDEDAGSGEDQEQGGPICDEKPLLVEERSVEVLNGLPEDVHVDQNDEYQEQGAPICDDTPPLVEERSVEVLNELPVDVHADQNDDSEASDVDWNASYHSSQRLDYGYEYTRAKVEEPDPEAGGEKGVVGDEFIVCSGGKVCSFDEVSQESYEESVNSDAFSSSDNGESSTDSFEEHSESASDDDDDDDEHILSETSFYKPSHVDEPILSETSFDKPSHDDKHILSKTSFDKPCHDDEHILSETSFVKPSHDDEHILSETSFDKPSHESVPNEDAIAAEEEQVSDLENFDFGKEPHPKGSGGDNIQDDLWPETDETALALAIAKAKKLARESDDLGRFNPRGPNFLPLEPECDGEKVDLRHLDLNERKNSEEWMVDYALRQVVNKLAPARKKKVELLVEAFEKVMPIAKFDLQLMDRPVFDQCRDLMSQLSCFKQHNEANLTEHHEEHTSSME